MKSLSQGYSISRFKIIDLIRGTSIVKSLAEISEISKRGKEFIRSEQQSRLKSMLLFLKENHKAYADLLKLYSKAEIINEPEAVLKTLPVTNKTYMTNNMDSLLNHKNKGRIQKKQTGGSTGTPFRYYLNSTSVSQSWAYAYMLWNRYAGYNMGDPYISVAGNSFHSSKNKILEYFYHRLQNNYLINGDMISDNIKIDMKKLSGAKLIYGYPTSINLLLSCFPYLPQKMKNLNAVFTTSEILLPGIRESIEKKLNTKIYDMYGANDGGIVSSECNYHNGYHYNMLNCYIESIKNENEQTELIVTNLCNYGFPFVRYKVDDLGTIETAQCQCGSPFDRIVNLMGRTRDMIYLPNGVCLHGSLFNSLLYKYPEIKLYKIIQEKDYSVKIRIMVEPETDYETVAGSLEKEIKQKFSKLQFNVYRLNEIEPTNNKFRVIESHVA